MPNTKPIRRKGMSEKRPSKLSVIVNQGFDYRHALRPVRISKHAKQGKRK